MGFKVGDWVLIGNGKKAHRLTQGNCGLSPRCTPTAHDKGTGMSYSAHVEPENMTDGSTAPKCLRCLRA